MARLDITFVMRSGVNMGRAGGEMRRSKALGREAVPLPAGTSRAGLWGHQARRLRLWRRTWNGRRRGSEAPPSGRGAPPPTPL